MKTIKKEVEIRELTRVVAMQSERIMQLETHITKMNERYKIPPPELDTKGIELGLIDPLRHNAFSIYNMGINLDILDKHHISKELVVQRMAFSERQMKQDIERMMNEVKNSKEICKKYQMEENKSRKEKEEIKRKQKSINLLHKSLLQNRVEEIETLKKQVLDTKQEWDDDINRLRSMTDKEIDVHVAIEKQHNTRIEKLLQELKFVKQILRYPKLYYKYQDKNYEAIRHGFLTEDKKYMDMSEYGNRELFFKSDIQSPKILSTKQLKARSKSGILYLEFVSRTASRASRSRVKSLKGSSSNKKGMIYYCWY